MIAILLALTLLSSPAHADSTWCNGIVVSNGSCIGSESNVPPPAVYCDASGRCYRHDGGSNLEKF
jgi:hypothetical protein